MGFGAFLYPTIQTKGTCLNTKPVPYAHLSVSTMPPTGIKLKTSDLPTGLSTRLSITNFYFLMFNRGATIFWPAIDRGATIFWPAVPSARVKRKQFFLQKKI